MSSRCREGRGTRDARRLASARRRWLLGAAALIATVVVSLAGVGATTLEGRGTRASLVPRPSSLRVCADPNNLPFSNRAREGFENRIAEVVGRALHEPVTYTWWAQRRGFVRNTLKARSCDVWIGTAAGMDMLLTTQPYYRSTYVFVSRADRHLHVRSLDDPALHRLRIGVQLVGDDFANTPPVHALARRGIVRNIVGYTLYGDYSQPNPPARIIDAVARGDVDLAIAWGPLAGYFAQRSPVPLEIVPVSPARDGPLPFVFDIAMGVRKGDVALRHRLDQVLAREKPAIDSILAAYGVPRVPVTTAATAVEGDRE